MSTHRAVVATGPGAIRRLCCPASETETHTATLAAIDDPVALVGGRPAAVDALWRTTLRSLIEGHRGLTVVYPSWWSASRIGVVSAAARTVAGAEVVVHPRSWLLAHRNSTLVVEIAERLVAISGPGRRVAAVPRRGEESAVAAEVTRDMATMTLSAVLIDAPSTVPGAAGLARLIDDAVMPGKTVTTVDDAAADRLAREAEPIPDGEPVTRPRAVGRSGARLATAAVAVTVAGLAVCAVSVEHPPPGIRTEPTTVLVEGGVALTIPADWPARRVIVGPGSARVQITSPSDPEAALHVTQTPTPGETLAGAADRLRRAIDAAPAGVFVEFNPAGVSAGRPAVTYREIRSAHDVRWTVLLDGSVRISIGCQSRPAARDAVRDACEQAVRTAHALG